MPEEKKVKVAQVIVNPLLPVMHCDHVAITTRSDDLLFLRFCSLLPEGIFEQAKLMISANSLKSMIDVLCKVCKYYPTEPKEAEGKTTAKER